MPRSAEKFARLLTEGIYRVRLREEKTIQIIQDELGYELGREGGSSIEYWRKGHLPPNLSDIEKLGREIVRRGGMDRSWLEQFLTSGDHPYPDQLCEELFPAAPPDGSQQRSPAPNERTDAGDSERIPPGQNILPENDFDPFIVGPPIVHPHQFFGREYELKRIFGLWRRFPLQNVAITGHKRSGKTSLLHYLKNITLAEPARLRPQQKQDWLPQPGRYRWVFVDFQDVRMCKRERLLRYLLESLEMPIPAPCDLESFMDIVSTHLQSPAIILMDEIGAALTSPELDQQFWGSLRSLGSNLTGGNLAFLLTAHEPPAELAQEHGKPSPFFNIFGHTFRLGPITEAEARSLIASSPRPFAPEDIDWILTQSGHWPYLLQVLCHARLTALENGETDAAWQREGVRQMARYWYLLGEG